MMTSPPRLKRELTGMHAAGAVCAKGMVACVYVEHGLL